RFFSDTWGIVAHTVTLGYTQPLWGHWLFDGTVRYYRQNAANFFADIYPRPNFSNFMARDRELAAFQSYTVGAGVTYQFGGIAHLPWISKSTLNLRFDHLLINYSDYRNALLIDKNPDQSSNWMWLKQSDVDTWMAAIGFYPAEQFNVFDDRYFVSYQRP